MNRHLISVIECVALLGFVIAAHAQIEITDNSCTVLTSQECSGPTGQGCASTAFSPGTTGNYTFTLSMSGCTKTTACPNCFAMGYVYDDRGQQVWCLHLGCGCISTKHTVSPSPSRTYTLYACKLNCFTQNDCSNCPEVCVVHATLEAE